jgi:hypothetical protein
LISYEGAPPGLLIIYEGASLAATVLVDEPAEDQDGPPAALANDAETMIAP